MNDFEDDNSSLGGKIVMSNNDCSIQMMIQAMTPFKEGSKDS